MPLKLSVRVGQSIAIGGPTTMRVETKSGQVVGLVFDADRSVPIRIIPERDDTGTPKPRSEPVGLGLDDDATRRSPGLATKQR
jgi:hypothetical protein